jgi:hypothetical protein
LVRFENNQLKSNWQPNCAGRPNRILDLFDDEQNGIKDYVL